MGAMCTKPEVKASPKPMVPRKSRADQIDMSLGERKMLVNKSSTEEEEEEQRMKEEERRLHDIMRREQNDLSDQVKSLFISGTDETHQVVREEEALPVTKHTLRKKEKLEAESKQKWMIFSSPDLLDEADVPPLTIFMDACMRYVPERQRKILEESHAELNIIDEDTDKIQVRSQLSDMSIVLAPNRQVEDSGVISVTRKQSSSSKIKVNREGSLSLLKGLEGMHVASTAAPVTLHSSLQDYELPKGYISSSIAAEVVEVYKRGGRLSRESVHKVLRLGFRSLKELDNTIKMTVGPQDRLTVVGDLHGQLADLLHILEESKLPSKTNKYIFNGDFVDRGPMGVEVVCVMLALLAAWPQSVVLNRGNHEDYAICCVYGFQKECIDKYDEITFGMFCEVFQYLPLFTIVNGVVLVVHGGLFHSADVTLSDLDLIKRHTFTLHDLPEGGETLESVPRDQPDAYYQQLQRDALWSDPHDIAGISPSARGAGVNFGADLTSAFLERNGLLMVVRSHECVERGFDMPYSGDARGLMVTIFSASNYGGCGNQGAYMVFTNCGPVATGTMVTPSIFYTVHSFDTSFEGYNDLTLHGMIIKKRLSLADAFCAEDLNNRGVVSLVKWAEIMQKVVGVKIQWQMLSGMIVPASCVQPGGDIEYIRFLNEFESMKVPDNDSDAGIGQDEEEINYHIVESVYVQAQKLEDVFNFFDSDEDGIINIDELREGCARLNEHLSEEARIADPDRIMRIINVDETGEMDMNEFFETYRILEYYNASHGHLLRRGSVSANIENVPAGLNGSADLTPGGGLARVASRSSLAALDINGVNIVVD